jgi:hypothetical protein
VGDADACARGSGADDVALGLDAVSGVVVEAEQDAERGLGVVDLADGEGSCDGAGREAGRGDREDVGEGAGKASGDLGACDGGM